ncbi:uncharacterized protein EHS24_005880 [Apiotrichum porosum]|uniref:Uncharacterized protein n=1 Tax=Apiotrichum porosum TaxID=105984 RepID=A0A427XZX3_9TREE|nr:uncharacterized protein EHS24_005880 [Apiotrichum porosum]RSH84360.1 hypothetical protein EHS24_005880 [Apiotrichum porosum]
MDKPLNSPLLIEPIGRPTKLSPAATFSHLQNFLVALPPSPSRTQLERLADALGVETGAIAPSEGERREAERIAARNAARAERRAKREAERIAAEAEEAAKLEQQLEEDDEEEEEDGEAFEGDETMGDIEYGDVPDDEDEPDNREGKDAEDDE